MNVALQSSTVDIKLEAGESLVLNERETGLLIRSGRVEIYAALLRDGQPVAKVVRLDSAVRRTGRGSLRGKITDPSNCFIYGDILVYTGTCPVSMDNSTSLICNTLKTRGLVLEDTTGTATGNQNIRSGLDVGLVDRISSSAWTWMEQLKLKGNFYVIDRCVITAGQSCPNARRRSAKGQH